MIFPRSVGRPIASSNCSCVIGFNCAAGKLQKLRIVCMSLDQPVLVGEYQSLDPVLGALYPLFGLHSAIDLGQAEFHLIKFR